MDNLPPMLNVLAAVAFVLPVIGMLPYIEAQDGDHVRRANALHQGIVYTCAHKMEAMMTFSTAAAAPLQCARRSLPWLAVEQMPNLPFGSTPSQTQPDPKRDTAAAV